MYNVCEHTINAVSSIEDDKVLRWTMLLHDIGKPLTKSTDSSGIDHFYGHQKVSCDLSFNILKRLRFDNKSIDTILKLVEHHDMTIDCDSKSIKSALRILGKELFFMLLKVKEADMRAQNIIIS
jgi:tRNA nucleotidyltransferase (CCA-adding enzyme)